ncbi:MAG TPA: membrane protein insertion efficiency factor YidD [Rhabdochlamydiaceae bacterium]|jgi:putative component of membrane protein insertase Oxa1/YidC/SpoIIIJ protein YidD
MRFSRSIFLLLLIPLSLCARPGYFTPWGKDTELLYGTANTAATASPHSSLLSIGAEKLILFHQNVLSPVDGPRSHFEPSSSNYMLNAIQKYGFFKGFALGCDRLLRENRDKWFYKTIEKDGKLFKYNPVP